MWVKIIIKIVVYAIVTILTAYFGTWGVLDATATKQCAEMSWAHATVTYDLKEYCWTVYQASEAMGPLRDIQKYYKTHKGPGF